MTRRLGATAAVCWKACIHPAVLALSELLGEAASSSAMLASRRVTQPPAARAPTLAGRRLLALLAQAARVQRRLSLQMLAIAAGIVALCAWQAPLCRLDAGLDFCRAAS